MKLIHRLKLNSTIVLLGILLLFLLALQSWLTYANYQKEKKLLVRNLNESMQSAFEAFRQFDFHADTLKSILEKTPRATSFKFEEGKTKNLILNPDFELGDTLFSSETPAYKFSPGSRIAEKFGLHSVGDSSAIFNYSWKGKGFYKNDKFLVVDGPTLAGVKIWQQKIKTKKNQQYKFDFFAATLVVSPIVKKQNDYWGRALLEIRINGNVKGYLFAPDHVNEWIPFQCSWFSENDSIADISISDVNTGGRYNDFALDHFDFFETENTSAEKKPTTLLFNGPTQNPSGNLDEKINIADQLIEEEFSFRSVKVDFHLEIIPVNKFAEMETPFFPLFYYGSSKYYERFYTVNGNLFSNYFTLDDATLCKCCVENYTTYLFEKIFGQLLLIIFSCSLSVFCLFMIRRFLRKQELLTNLKYDITSSITHELKTPVATILAATEALQQFGMINDKNKTEKYLDITRINALRINELIEKALNFSSVEEEGFALSLHPTDINRLILDVVEKLKENENPKLELSTELPEHGVILNIDKFHVDTILQTLIDNALKYGNENVRVKLRVEEQQDSVSISVRDNGPGIPPRFHKLVFEKYFRVPNNDHYQVKGHGLGLHYVKIIMNLHKGEAKISSDGKSGTEILLKFRKTK